MRQFILAGDKAYPVQSGELTEVEDGAVGFYYNNEGAPTPASTGKEFKTGMLVLGRDEENGGPVVLPVFKNNFSYVKGEYVEAKTFSGTVTVLKPEVVGDYTIIIALKGAKFNERNKWTATVHITDLSVTAAQLANRLVVAINSNTDASGVHASNNGATITVTANEKAIDYNLIVADNLSGATVKITTVATFAYGDVNYIKDLADKAAADAGFNYTYNDSYDLYKTYPIGSSISSNLSDKGYTIFTIRFSEPRIVKTTDEAINQIIQVAFPTGAAGISTFETVCAGLADVEVGASSISTLSENDSDD